MKHYRNERKNVIRDVKTSVRKTVNLRCPLSLRKITNAAKTAVTKLTTCSQLSEVDRTETKLTS